jgi:anti-sigma B factor antagonist
VDGHEFLEPSHVRLAATARRRRAIVIVEEPGVTGSVPVPGPRDRASVGSLPKTLLRLQVQRPAPHSVVVRVAGELDLFTAPRLAELVTSRLQSELTALAIDLSEVEFLGSAGLGVLMEAHLLAQQREVRLSIVTGRCRVVRRALEVSGLDEVLPLDPEVAEPVVPQN